MTSTAAPKMKGCLFIGKQVKKEQALPGNQKRIARAWVRSRTCWGFDVRCAFPQKRPQSLSVILIPLVSRVDDAENGKT
ncbi:MAG: hypothetical protein IAE92_17735 [Burkholderiaceae bacterium]|nr:hypothetical protein [Burkholderiaceae bacterium]